MLLTFHFLFYYFAPIVRLPSLSLSAHALFTCSPMVCVSMSAGNFKATYQRARAHAALCHEDEARRDFDLVEKLDPKFKPFIRQELKKLGERMRVVHARQHKTYWDTTQEKWRGSEATGAERKMQSEKKRKAVQEPSKSEANTKVEKSKSEQEKEKSESEKKDKSGSNLEKEEEKNTSELVKEEENIESEKEEEKAESEKEKEE